MSERKFDYIAMQEAYQSLENEFANISTILSDIDVAYRDTVNVSEEAIYGSLGSQLLLNWDNVSSDFPNFMQNFENWSAVVAASGGNYAQFEKDIAGFKNVENGTYLGVSAAKAGVYTNYIESSTERAYANEHLEQYKTDVSNLKSLNALTGAVYDVANSQSLLKRHKIVTGIVGAADVLGLVWCGIAGYGLAFATPAAAAGTPALPPGETPPALPPGDGGASAGTALTETGTTGTALTETGATAGTTGGTAGATGGTAGATGGTAGATGGTAGATGGTAGATGGTAGATGGTAGAASTLGGASSVSSAASTGTAVTSTSGVSYSSGNAILEGVKNGTLGKREGIRLFKQFCSANNVVITDAGAAGTTTGWTHELLAAICNAG